MKRFKAKIAVMLACCMVITYVTPALAEVAAPSDAETATPSNAEVATPSNAEMLLLSAPPTHDGENLYEGEKWMSVLSENMKIKNLTVPEAHDACTYNIKFTKLDPVYEMVAAYVKSNLQDALGETIGGVVAWFASGIIDGLTKSLVNYIATAIQQQCGKCQNMTIERQLAIGVRAFDLRFRYENGKFNAYHGDENKGLKGIFGACECYDTDGSRLTLDKVFEKIEAFQNQEGHEKEVIFLKVQNEGGTYNSEVEAALKALEAEYGINTDYAQRDKKGKAFSALGEKSLKDVGGQIFDITEAIKDISGASWKATVANKKTKIQDAVDKYAMGLPGEIQCNIQMKVIWAIDPNNECKLHFTPKYFTFLGTKIPYDFEISFKDLFISPKENADAINPWTDALLERVIDEKQENVAENGLGLVSMDFLTRRLCWRIANVNSVNEDWCNGFMFVEGGDDDPDYPDQPVGPDKINVDVRDVYDYDKLRELIKGSAKKHQGSGDLTDSLAAGGSGTYSQYWQTDESGSWVVRDSRGEVVANTWLCDDAIRANGQNVWYLLGADGKMITAGLVQDNTGNFYSMETAHEGYFGALRYLDGEYECNGQKVYLQFNRNHNGSFGAITNPEGLEKLKAIYGVTNYAIGNESTQYTAQF